MVLAKLFAVLSEDVSGGFISGLLRIRIGVLCFKDTERLVNLGSTRCPQNMGSLFFGFASSAKHTVFCLGRVGVCV